MYEEDPCGFGCSLISGLFVMVVLIALSEIFGGWAVFVVLSFLAVVVGIAVIDTVQSEKTMQDKRWNGRILRNDLPKESGND